MSPIELLDPLLHYSTDSPLKLAEHVQFVSNLKIELGMVCYEEHVTQHVLFHRILDYKDITDKMFKNFVSFDIVNDI